MSNLTAAQLKDLSGLDLSVLQHLSVERLKEYIVQYSDPNFRLSKSAYFTPEEWVILLKAEIESRSLTK